MDQTLLAKETITKNPSKFIACTSVSSLVSHKVK